MAAVGDEELRRAFDELVQLVGVDFVLPGTCRPRRTTCGRNSRWRGTCGGSSRRRRRGGGATPSTAPGQRWFSTRSRSTRFASSFGRQPSAWSRPGHCRRCARGVVAARAATAPPSHRRRATGGGALAAWRQAAGRRPQQAAAARRRTSVRACLRWLRCRRRGKRSKSRA